MTPWTGRTLVAYRDQAAGRWYADYTETDVAAAMLAERGTLQVPLPWPLAANPIDVALHLSRLYPAYRVELRGVVRGQPAGFAVAASGQE